MAENNETNNSIPETNKVEEINKKEKSEAEVFEALPPEAKKGIEMMLSMQRISGPLPNPLLSKITEGHIDRILDISKEEEHNSYKDAQSTKIYSLIYFFAILLFICFIIYFLIDKDKTLLTNIIDKGLYFIGGILGGYGLKAYSDNKKKK